VTRLEYEVGLKVLEQFYITRELVGLLKLSYDNNMVSITWNYSRDLDKYLSKSYNIKEENVNSKHTYFIKDLKSLFYFCQTCRNNFLANIDIPPIDALDYMVESAKKALFNKGCFILSNEEWMNKIKKEKFYLSAIKQNRIDVIDILNQFDENVNPFINEDFNSEMVDNIFDIDVYNEDNIDNCAHFIIKDDNLIKKYCRHSKGFSYSLKRYTKDYVLYVGHYFNVANNGEVVSIVININNKEYKIRYNITDKNVELFGKRKELQMII